MRTADREVPMAYRSFRDEEGRPWEAWDVTPQLQERRRADRRAGSAAAANGADRRVRSERRMRGNARAALAGLEQGWLCFEAPREKRRLSPIPSDWVRCDEARLREYCRQAKPSGRARRASEVVSDPAII
jgi:hypothetical protein